MDRRIGEDMPLSIQTLRTELKEPNKPGAGMVVTAQLTGMGIGQLSGELYFPGDTEPREKASVRAFGMSPKAQLVFKTPMIIGANVTIKVKMGQGLGLLRVSEPATVVWGVAVHGADFNGQGQSGNQG